MSENEEKSVALNFLAGVGIGALVGAGIALLLAPKSGSETREDLKAAMADLSKSTDEFKKRSMEAIDNARTKVQQTYETGRENVQKRFGHESSDESPA